MLECVATLTAQWESQVPQPVFADFTSLIGTLAFASNNGHQHVTGHNSDANKSTYIGSYYTLTSNGPLLILVSPVPDGTDWSSLANWLQDRGATVNWGVAKVEVETDELCFDDEEEPDIFDFVPGEEIIDPISE